MVAPMKPIATFLQHARQAWSAKTWIELRLSPDQGFTATLRPVDLREGPALCWVTHEPRRDLTRNLEPTAALAEVERLLAEGGTAWLRTSAKAWQLVAKTDQRPRLVAHAASPVATPSREHNRAKHHHLTNATAWLQALEITDARGRPRPGQGDKLRQIERYADLLSHLIKEADWPAGSTPTLADMGCGKGYLTFAAWHLLRHKLGYAAQVIGLDAQPGVVTSAQNVAQLVHAEGLSFTVGAIQDAQLPALDGLIALHACNDATDHALVRGVAAGARIIVVAPCCHKDVRRALGTPPPLASLLEHGLFKERFAEWLTDGLRVLALEAAGYRVTVSEFVDAVHTPKNVFIGAVRGLNDARRTAARAEYAAIKAWAGLGELAIDKVM